MGDRCTFIFADTLEAPEGVDAHDPIVTMLYSHWGGESRHEDLAHAIAKALPRWTDPSYATRICVSQIIGSDWDSETGFGLFSCRLSECFSGWNDREPLMVDWHGKTVSIAESGEVITLDAYVRRWLDSDSPVLEQYRANQPDDFLTRQELIWNGMKPNNRSTSA